MVASINLPARRNRSPRILYNRACDVVGGIVLCRFLAAGMPSEVRDAGRVLPGPAVEVRFRGIRDTSSGSFEEDSLREPG